MNHHHYYAAAETLLDEISAEDDTVGRAMIAIFGTAPNEEMPDQEHDPSICVCGDPWCNGCPSHDELVREGIIGEAGEELDGDSDWEYEADDNSQGTAKWT